METSLKNKNVLVVGIGKSGIATVRALFKMGAKICVNDMKSLEELGTLYDELSIMVDEFILAKQPNASLYDLVILSPGVPTDLEFIVKAKQDGVEIIGEIEFAYRYCQSSFIAITGTNGKTTTTSLVGEIFKLADVPSYVVGNIGTPVVEVVAKSDENTFMITEVSSFQLETIDSFRPKVAAILNITPDHLNRHKTMQAYMEAKFRVFENQSVNDILILNYDNEITRNIANQKNILSEVIYFSKDKSFDKGVYVEDEVIYVSYDNQVVKICNVSDIFILGNHNLENVLAAVGISYFSGIEPKFIASAIKNFKGVEHRIEYVNTINGVKFYNDSKGTNPDASIQAVKAMDRPTVLIAGGMDKGSDFTEFIDAFGDKIKAMIVFGETKNIIEETALKIGFKNVYICETLNQAVTKAYSMCEDGYNVLLSPACASWDMYSSYEVRGREFKDIVNSLN